MGGGALQPCYSLRMCFRATLVIFTPSINVVYFHLFLACFAILCTTNLVFFFDLQHDS